MVVRCGATSRRRRTAKCHSGRSEMYIVMQNGRFRITLQRYEKSLKPPNIYGQNSPVSARFLPVFCMCQFRRENQRAETRLVDEDRLTFVVRTSVANCDGGLPSSSTCFLRAGHQRTDHGVSYIFLVHSTVAYKGKNQRCYEDLTNS